jgi:hypothetical protein
MPRLRRRAKLRTKFVFEAQHERHLLTGRDYLGTAFADDIEAMRNAWAEHGSRLLQQFIFENPGRRPWAWWAFNAPRPAPPDDPRLPKVCPPGLKIWHLGRPPQDESEADFLRRHEMLTAAEEKLFPEGPNA